MLDSVQVFMDIGCDTTQYSVTKHHRSRTED